MDNGWEIATKPLLRLVASAASDDVASDRNPNPNSTCPVDVRTGNKPGDTPYSFFKSFLTKFQPTTRGSNAVCLDCEPPGKYSSGYGLWPKPFCRPIRR